MAVIDRQDKSTIHPPSNLLHPVYSMEIHLGSVAFQPGGIQLL